MQNISLCLPTCSCINRRSFRGNRRLVSPRCGSLTLPFCPPPRYLISSQPHFSSPSHSPITNANPCRLLSLPQTWITALQAFFVIGEFSAGKTILWHAGASSVSIAGIQLSIAQGASAVYITAGSSEKIKFCTQTLGATAGYNYHTQDWAKEVLAATDGKGVDIIIDFVGQNYFQQNLDAVANDGRIVHLGSLSGTKLPAGVDIGAFVRKRIRFEGSSLRSRDEGYQKKLRDLFEEHALPGLRDGRLKVFIERVYPWEEVVDAQKLLEQNGTMGKVICTVAAT